MLRTIDVVFRISIIPRHLQHLVGNEILARAVALHNGRHHILRHIFIIGQQLLGVLRQTVSTITKRRVVVVRANSRIETDTVDDGLRVETLDFGVGVQLVKVTHPQRQIGVGEELHGLSLFHPNEEDRHILLDGGVSEQPSEDVRPLGEPLQVGQGLDGLVLLPEPVPHDLGDADDDTAGVEIVIEGLALPQELGREQEVELFDPFLPVLDVEAAGVADGDGALDDHDGVGVDLQHGVDDGLHGAGVEEVLLGVVVGGRGDDDELGVAVAGVLVEGGLEVEGLGGQVFFDVVVLDGRLFVVDHVDAFGDDVHGGDLVMLGEQCGDAHADIAGSCY